MDLIQKVVEHKEPTERDKLLSEINMNRKIGHWKRANDLLKSYNKKIKKGII